MNRAFKDACDKLKLPPVQVFFLAYNYKTEIPVTLEEALWSLRTFQETEKLPSEIENYCIDVLSGRIPIMQVPKKVIVK